MRSVLRSRSTRALAITLLGAMYLGISLIIQWWSNTSAREFTSDESLHYITAVVLRDLILSRQYAAPIAFILDFYTHYQFVGLGLWPPGYHLMMAAWGCVLGVGHASIMSFQACLGASLALMASLAALPALGPWVAVMIGVAVLANPLTLNSIVSLSADLPTALFMLAASLAFVRLLSFGRLKDGALFGVLALAAIMIKGNAIALALLPPVAVALSRRWNVVRRPGFWLPALIILPIAAPWYGLTVSWASAGFRYAIGQEYTAAALKFIVVQTLETYGAVIILLFVLSAAATAFRIGERHHLWSCMLGLIISTAIFQSVVPAALEARYLLPMVAPVLILAARGACLIVSRLRASAWREVVAATAFAVGIVTMIPSYGIPPPVIVGGRSLAMAVRPLLPPSDMVVLIASDANGEGALSSELAMGDAVRPRITVARGVRLLGGGGYNNFQYQPRFTNPEDAVALVEDLGIPLVIVDRSKAASAWAHVEQLGNALDRPGSSWTKVDTVRSGVRTYDLFMRRYPAAGPTRYERLAEYLRPAKKLP